MNEFRMIELRVFKWLIELSCEFEYIGSSPLLEKFKFMLLMTYFDIFSQVWGQFADNYGKHEYQKYKFIDWSETFFLNSKNEKYESHRTEFRLLNSTALYNLRCSLIHMGGLSIRTSAEMVRETDDAIDTTPIFISEFSSQEFHEQFSSQLQGREALVLSSKVYFPIAANAVAIMLGAIERIRQTRPQMYCEGIRKLHSRIENESASRIIFDKNNCK